LDGRNLDGVIAHCTPGCRFYGFAPETLDVDGYKAAMSHLLEAFPDSRFHIDDVVAENDRVAVRHRMQGTHQNPFQGVPATGRRVTVNAIAILHLKEGRSDEIWLNADFLGLMQQLGAIPAPA
jgi:predicted ester cyclase